ncbi:MAG: D-ribose pyranase [Erysipelotrichaceae bacterium]|nr:D-ribose pyranase [Erysipelotrichaceae bacterium]MDP3305843.1 D-ribose pyranase [Erysipelotrichaceae bacterium]
MKKRGILNSDIAKVLVDLGHTDKICIADAGLPVPNGVKKIDLALKKGLPSFIDTLKTVLDDMWIEKIYLANEIKEHNGKVLGEISELVGEVSTTYISHEDFKELTKDCKVVIRTGEMTPYANVILQSNVNFSDEV